VAAAHAAAAPTPTVADKVAAAAPAVTKAAATVAVDAAEVAAAAIKVAEVAEAAPAIAAQADKAKADAAAAVLAAGKAAAAEAAAAKQQLAAQAAATKQQVQADVQGIKSALLTAANDIKKAAEGNMPAIKVTTTVTEAPAPVPVAAKAAAAPAVAEPAAAAAAAAAEPASSAAAAPAFNLDTLINAAQSLNLTQVKGIADKVADVREAAGELNLGQFDVKNLTSVLTMLTKLPAAAKGLGLDVKLPDVPAVEQLEKIDVAQVVSLFNTAKVLVPKVNLTGAAETKAGGAARQVMKALLWKQKVQSASMQLASSVALGVLTEGVSGMHNVSTGMAHQALKAVGMKIPGAEMLAGSGLGSSMNVLKRAKKELDEELVAKLRRSTELLNDLSGALQKQAAEGKGGFGQNMFVQLCNAKLDQLKLALAGKPVTPGLGEGMLWAQGTLPKPVYAAAPWMKPTLACVKQCKGTTRQPVCTGKMQTWGNECLAKCIGARVIKPGVCPPVVIGTA
jgi:hypothetical protein